jgi:beta-lactamase regulating signal transducer with metallopeptidase domain
MIFLLNCAVKVSLILVVTLIAVRLLRRQSAALRHCVLAAGIFSAAITPGLNALIPGWTWTVIVDAPAQPPAYSAVAETASSTSHSFIPMPLPRPSANEAPKPRQAATTFPPGTVSPQRGWFSYSLSVAGALALLWMAGFGVSFSLLLIGYARLLWIARQSRPLDSEVWRSVAGQICREYALPRSPRLLQNDRLSVLFTWGWRRPRVLVPESAPSWPIERVHAVLCHELAHIRRGDWIIQMTAELVRTVYWFNPLLWLACRNLRRESEQACDDAALNSGIAGSDYAAHVLDVLKSLHHPRRAWSYALSMAGPSTLEQRFVAILNPSVNRQTMTRLSIVAVLAVFSLVTVPLSSLTGAAAVAEPALSLFEGRGAPVPPLSLQATPPSTERTGIVQGVVRRAGTGEPVAGVEISLDGGPADQKLVDSLVRGAANRGVIFKPKRIGTVDEVLQDVLDAAGEIGVGPGFPLFQEALDNFTNAAAARFTAISDKDGRFTIRNVLAGDYFVQPAREGFFDPALGLGGPRSPRLGITVTAGMTTETTVDLLSGGVMSGRVVDANGRPIQDAIVDALAMTYQNGYPVLRAINTKTTDDEGEYRLFWLVPGEYYLQVAVPPPPGAGPGPVNMTAPSQFSGATRTFYPGTIDVGAATPLTVRPGDKLSGLDIQVRPAPLARVSGTFTTTIPAEETAQQAAVLSANPGLQRPSLMLVSRDSNNPDVTGGGARAVGVVQLNNGVGQFQTQGIPPGSYILLGRIPESNAQGGAGFAFGRAYIDVGKEDISGVAIKVDHSINVSGKVTVNGRAPQTPVRVTLRVDDSSMKLGIYSTLSTRYVASDKDGAFTMIQVPPGPYHIDIGPGLPNNLYIADVRQSARSVFDSGFEITSQVPDPIEVALSSGAGTVEGIVEDGAGKPVAGAAVVLAPPENRRQNRVLFHQVMTDKTGRFTLRNIAPGNYKLFSWQQALPANTWFNPGFMLKYEASGRPINVTQDGTVTQQLRVIP